MKRFYVLALGLIAASMVAAELPIVPGDATALPAALNDSTELSAARKKVRAKRVVVAEPVVVRRWRGPDPSFDEHGRLYRPPPGLYCPIDLGYGRWGSCSNR